MHMKKICRLCSICLVSGLLITSSIHVRAEEYEYDDLNRVTKVTYEDGSFVTYEYDANGNIISTTVVEAEQSSSESTEESETAENSETSETGETSETSETSETGETEESTQPTETEESTEPEEDKNVVEKVIDAVVDTAKDVVDAIVDFFKKIFGF